MKYLSLVVLLFVPSVLLAEDCRKAAESVAEGVALADGTPAEASHYQNAISYCPSMANAYYNLASAHLQRKETVQAYQAMQRTVALLEAGSADFVKAQEELAKLEEQVKKENPQAVAGAQPNTQAPVAGELQTPLPTPTANPQVRVDLNEESGPQTLPQQEETQVDEVLEQPAPTPAP